MGKAAHGFTVKVLDWYSCSICSFIAEEEEVKRWKSQSLTVLHKELQQVLSLHHQQQFFIFYSHPLPWSCNDSWNTPVLLSLTQERQGSLPRSFYFYHQAPDRCDTYKNRVRLRRGSCTKALWKQSPGGQKLPVQQNSKSLLHLDYRLQKQGFTNLLIHGILSWRC